MARIDIPRVEITYKDVFIMKYLYTVVHEWLEENGWKDPAGGTDHQFIEELYLEKRFADGTKEHRIWWRSSKDAEGSTYYKYHLDINYRTLYMRDVEVMHKSQKIKAQNAELTVYLLPWIDVDIEGKWAKHPILRYIEWFFRTRIMKKELENHKRLLYREAYRLHGMIKKYLELRTFAPAAETFHEKFDNL